MRFSTNNELNKVRIDKWLWAARFFKTRQLAVKALKTSKVSLNGQNCKPAAMVKAGDIVSIKRGFHQMEVEIRLLSDNRGPASVAQTLYSETENSKITREKVSEQIAAQPKISFETRKPDKRGVRTNRALKRGD
ncbi:MAG: RNA-binding S4 domain-containing protein [Gammaproteobacteria bacterium]|nr:RNA-binding S4 domain-containing protein [Gammaproteobacteria bacterium]